MMWLQVLPTKCLELLQTLADAFSGWSASVGAVIQQQSQQQLAKGTPQLAELCEAGIWLPLAAGSLLQCMQHTQWWEPVDELWLLDILGQLAQQVSLMPVAAAAAAA
jgi:hypothetical protein